LNRSISILKKQQRKEQFFEQFKLKPFWIWDREWHKKQHAIFSGRCCFNHIIGLPVKNSKKMPLFNYEQEIFDVLQETKHVWIKKATGLGITEFMLRYVAWLCLRDDKLKGSRMCIVTGPRIDLAITLVERIKALFPTMGFDSKETVVQLIGVKIEAFPSHHLDAMRGLPNVSFILLDEADFFPLGQQQDARAVSERYIAKSDPYIVMVSTPNAPEGLFEEIEREPDDKCLYKRLLFDYTIGLGKIYTQQEITEVRESPHFEREYNLKYIGQMGNVFSYESIQKAVEFGLHLEDIRKGYISPADPKSMGIDAGFGSSKFGIVVTQNFYGKAEVLYADEFERPDFVEMIDKIMAMRRNYGVRKLFVDGANPEIIASLKRVFNEPVDYEEHLAKIRRKKLGHPIYHMDVLPVSFNSEHTEMLLHTKLLLDRERLAIHPRFNKLLVALRTAVARDGILDKQTTAHDDLFDSLRLSLKYFLPPPLPKKKEQQ
jgi:hypothetical protein